MKGKSIAYSLIITAVLMALYVLTRYKMPQFYTPEWAARNVFWLAASVIMISALLDKIKFSFSAFCGYILGLVLGEVFGGFNAEIAPEYKHYGWLILIIVFFISCIIGAVLQKKR